jgi:hypothetical protein
MQRKYAKYYISHSYSPYDLPRILLISGRVGAIPRDLKYNIGATDIVRYRPSLAA